MTTSYTYDAFGRLKEVIVQDSGRIAYSYDDSGNRQRRTVTASGRTFEADLSMSSAAPEIAVGHRVFLVLTIKNLGPDAATQVKVPISVTGPFRMVELWSSQGGCAGEPVVCTLGVLGAGDSARIEVRVVPTGTNVISASGTASAPEPDPQASNDAAALSVSASFGPTGDADGDGVPDSWESRYGFDPHYAPDAGIDPDRDGLSNREEYAAASNPLRANLDADELAELAELRERAARLMPIINFIILDDDDE
ncbi:MAG: hypothetical protein ACR2RL_10850 [Gammaproteobacteria bacterium]